MLNQAAAAMRVANRAMVTRHRNAMDCQVYRKTVTRTAGAESGSLGGLPSLGGMGVIDSEDEAQVDFTLLGEGKVLFTQRYEGSTLADRRDNAEATTGEALIEPNEEGAFEPKDGDLIMAMPGAGVVITYEVSRVLNVVNIPPYVAKYELEPQGDLMFLPEVAASQADRP